MFSLAIPTLSTLTYMKDDTFDSGMTETNEDGDGW